MEGRILKYFSLVLTTLVLGCSSDMDSEVDLLTSFDFESGTRIELILPCQIEPA